MLRAGFFSLVLLILVACSREESAAGPAENQRADSLPAEVETQAVGSVDPESGLIVGENWQLVRAHCGACHSTRLISQNAGDRDTWLSLIRWMQDSQGLWAFDPATESAILDYLALNYAPPAAGRRPALDPALLPPNPYDD